MSAPPGLQPILLRDAVLTVDGDNFSAAILGAAFTPQVSYDWEDSHDGVGMPFYTSVHWTVTLSYVQDLRPGSLTRYLLEQSAATRSLSFTPQPGMFGPPISADAMIVPGTLGGTTQDGILTAQVTLPLFGEPVVG